MESINNKTETERLIRQSEEKFRTLAETLPQMVWMLDSDGKIEYSSSQWKEYSGIEDTTEAWWAMIHPEDREAVMEAWDRHLENGQSFRYEVRLKNKLGEYHWHYSIAEPLRDENGNVFKWIGSLIDIQVQKTFSEKLERKVAERTRDLQRSNEDLQRFAHIASHDLKEPARKIRIISSELLSDFGHAMPDEAKSMILNIESAAQRMYSMIEGILQYSSLAETEQAIVDVDLNEIIAEILVDLEISIHQRKAIIVRDRLPVIEGSRLLLYQLFYNLVNNSLKFSNEEDSAIVKINATIKPGSIVEISVADNGIGIPDSELGSIFHPFTRLHSKDKFEGTGIGLSLCKRIVERHHGTIRGEKKSDPGALFIITLPIKQSIADQ